MNELRCPACTAPGLLADRGGGVRCDHCGTFFHVPMVHCPACGWENPQIAENCVHCGEPLTVIAQVLTRQRTTGPPRWLGRVRGRAGDLKEQGARASEQRLEHLQEIDRRRQLEDARELARQRATDRQIMLVLGVALGILGVVVVVLIVISTQGG